MSNEEIVKRVACPQCGAPAGAKCRGKSNGAVHPKRSGLADRFWSPVDTDSLPPSRRLHYTNPNRN